MIIIQYIYKKILTFQKKDIFIDNIESNIRIQNEVFKQIKKISKGSNLYVLYIPNKKDFLKDKKISYFMKLKKLQI